MAYVIIGSAMLFLWVATTITAIVLIGWIVVDAIRERRSNRVSSKRKR